MEIKNNKKSLSEIVSYVLLIVISLALAVGVYSWMRYYIPSINEREVCPEEISIVINDYNCNLSSSPKTLLLEIENKGRFNMDGFITKISNNTAFPATIPIETTYPGMAAFFNPAGIEGRYDFGFINQDFTPGNPIQVEFLYPDIDSIKKVWIQPYLIGEKKKTLILCDKILKLDLENC